MSRIEINSCVYKKKYTNEDNLKDIKYYSQVFIRRFVNDSS